MEHKEENPNGHEKENKDRESKPRFNEDQKRSRLVVKTPKSNFSISGTPRVTYVNKPFNFFPTVNDDNGSGISFSATNLPPGAILDPTNGGLKGYAKKSGTYVSEYTAKQSGEMAQATFTFQVFDVLEISGHPHSAYVGKEYSFQPTVAYTGNRANLSWSASNLPPGLSINGSTGQITGTPLGEAVGTSFLTCTDGCSTVPLELRIPVVLPVTIQGIPAPAPINTYYQFVPLFGNLMNGNVKIVTTIASGTLPDGLILNSNGAITGIPTAVGSSQVTFLYDVGYMQTTKTFTFDVIAPLGVSSFLPVSAAFLPYSAPIQLKNKSATGTYNYQIVYGSLAPGLTLDTNTGVISGTPYLSGIYPFVLEVSDGTTLVSQQFSLTVNDPTEEEFLASSAYTGSNTLNEQVLEVLALPYILGNVNGASSDQAELQKYGNMLVMIFVKLKTRFTPTALESGLINTLQQGNNWDAFSPSVVEANLNASTESEALVKKALVFYTNFYNAYKTPSIRVNKCALLRAGVHNSLATYLYWKQSQLLNTALTNTQSSQTM